MSRLATLLHTLKSLKDSGPLASLFFFAQKTSQDTGIPLSADYTKLSTRINSNQRVGKVS